MAPPACMLLDTMFKALGELWGGSWVGVVEIAPEEPANLSPSAGGSHMGVPQGSPAKLPCPVAALAMVMRPRGAKRPSYGPTSHTPLACPYWGGV